MKFDASANTFEQAPVGTHLAKFIRVIDIGTQEGEYKGEKTIRRQLIVTWELPMETREDGQPFIISKFYTASLGEKANLTKDLTNAFGATPDAKTFDPKKLLGKDCQVVVSQREGSDKRVVSGLASVPKGLKAPAKAHNPLVYFDLDEYDEEVFNSLSEGIQKMIMKSPEYEKIINGEPDVEVAAAAGDADIPF